jgi:hypothetical protein
MISEIPPVLNDLAMLIESSIKRLDRLTRNTSLRNIERYLATIQSYTIQTDALIEASETLVVRCRELSQEYADLSVPSDHKALIQARELALLALDQLRDRLTSARPSKHAIALGLGW